MDKVIKIGLLFCFSIISISIFYSAVISKDKPLTRDECFRLGSNERTELCLIELESRNPQPTPIVAYFINDELSLIKLEEINIDFLSYPYNNPQPVLNAIVRNNSEFIAKEIVLKIKLYRDKGTCSDSAIDTIYIKGPSALLGGDSEKIKTPFNTNFNFEANKGFYDCVEVVSAKY